MKTTSARRVLAFTVLMTSTVASAQAPDHTDSWLVLNKITHKRSYTIETRDRKCSWGTISELTDDHLSANLYSSNPAGSPAVTFRRADVLRVSTGRLIYYSGRSSWSDVSSLDLEGRERLKIITMSGKTYEVKPPYAVSDEGITLDPSGRPTKIAKSEITRIYYIVVKPLTATGEYLAEELGPMIVFDPDWYAYGLHLVRQVPVLLYDANRPEDDSPAECARPGH